MDKSEGIPLEPTLSVPEKASLSKTTTIVDASSPRPSTSASEQLKNPFDVDVEALPVPGYGYDGLTPSTESLNPYSTTTTAGGRRGSVILNRKNDTQVWPGKDQWKQRAQDAKRHRQRRTPWTPWKELSKRNKIIAKVLIIVLIVGVAVGVGFGISKPLGASIWGKSN